MKSSKEYAEMARDLAAQLERRSKSDLVRLLAMVMVGRLVDRDLKSEYGPRIAETKARAAKAEARTKRLQEKLLSSAEKWQQDAMQILLQVREAPRIKGANGGRGRHKVAKEMTEILALEFIQSRKSPPSRARVVREILPKVKAIARDKDGLPLSDLTASKTVDGWVKKLVDPSLFAQRGGA